MTLNNSLITDLLPNGEDPSKRDLYIDGEFYLTVPYLFLLEQDLHVGDPFGEEEEERLLMAAQLTLSKEKAYQYLGYGDLSRKKLYEKLTRFGIEPKVAERTCEILEEQDLINDARLAAHLAERLYEGKHYGPKRILPELCQKGIPQELAKEAIEQLEREDKIHLAYWMEKKYRRFDLRDPKERQKVFQGLCRYGFSFDQINHILLDFSEEFE
ncbi:MAG: RecX family transcriptional regulator [Clostridia bacterium]|nr:RecX family transcriptional regulator [Clostridia bacterium]